MRILHIDETFHPLFGYHCNPLAKFQSLAGNEVFVIAPEAKYIYPVYREFGETGDNQQAEDEEYMSLTNVKIIRVKGKGYISGRLVYDMRLLSEAIDQINPDVIMVHCVETLTAMRVMKKYRNKYPMVFDSHMLSMATQNRFYKIYEWAYKHLITRMIIEEKYTVILTQNDDYVITHLGIPKEQTVFGSFGTDTSLFCPNINARNDLLVKYNIPEDAFVIVSTGKLSKSKNGKLFADAVKEKFNTNRDVVIVVVADFSGDYEKEVRQTLETSENRVLFFGVQKYVDLPWFYQIADVTVFPKQCSMSFYDAQSCGSPVISEKGHVNEERNSHGNGFCFEPDSYQDMRSVLNRMMSLTSNEILAMRNNSRDFILEGYSYTIIAKQYTDLMSEAILRFNAKQ